MRFTHFMTAVLVSLPLVAAVAPRALAETRIQSDIAYRKDLMFAMDWNLVRIAQMVRHQRPLDRNRLAYEGRALAALGVLPWTAFVPGSDYGETKAKPLIWQQGQAFQKAVLSFEAATRALQAATAQGRLSAVAHPLEEVARGCDSCHHRFMK